VETVEVAVLQAEVRAAEVVREAVSVLVAAVEEAQEVEEADRAVVGAAQVVQADRVPAEEQAVVEEVQADRAAHQAQAGVVAQAVADQAVADQAVADQGVADQGVGGQGPVVEVEVADQVERMGKVMGNVEGRERAAVRLKVGPVREEVELISISP
jgi:hypothetical protein